MAHRSTMILPNGLVLKAKKATGARNKTEAVIRSMELAVHHKNAERLVRLFGKLPIHVNIQKSRDRV